MSGCSKILAVRIAAMLKAIGTGGGLFNPLAVGNCVVAGHISASHAISWPDDPVGGNRRVKLYCRESCI